MKKILTLLLLVVATITVNAQTPPEAFNYSAVARDANSNPIANSTIGIQISIKIGSPTGNTVYQENHFVNTDDFGLFNLIVGGGSILSGTIADIDWSLDDYYLQVGMDASGGTNFLNMGSTQLLSVPYALYAKSAGSAGGIQISSISMDGDTLYLSNGQTFVNDSNGGQNGGLVNPTITTDMPTDITSNSATLGGTISNANGNQIGLRGVVYSTSPNPTLFSDSIVVGSGIGSFNINALDVPGEDYHYEYLLNANTTYYVRAYAVTENNTVAYGNEVSFTTLPVGQTGPGGGLVFYDKGNNIGGWQYLEAAPSDSPGIGWGCNGILIGGTDDAIGSGEANTNQIVSGCNEASFAAQLCNDLTEGGQTDWFLPSVSELKLMHQNLYLNNVGNLQSGFYWSSSENSAFNAWIFLPYNGFADSGNTKNASFYVRAVRAF